MGVVGFTGLLCVELELVELVEGIELAVERRAGSFWTRGACCATAGGL